MSGFPSPEQRKAIEGSGNLIVSASAGAGKTTVLAERVLRLVSEDVPIERMLILTFTRAAASEMKTRIGARILKEAKKNPARAAYFRGQAAAVANASISTIDAFCAKIVFRHFFRVGLTPSCKTLDDTQSKVLEAEIRDAALDLLANENPEAYRELILAFGNDPELVSAVQSFDGFLSTQPDPEEWLDRREAALDDPAAFSEQLAWKLRQDKTRLLMYIEELQRETDGVSPAYERVLNILHEILSHARGALQMDTREAYAAALSAAVEVKGTLSFPKGTPDAEREGPQNAKRKLLELCRKQIARHTVPFETLLEDERKAAPVLKAFFALIRTYRNAFREAKRARNALDFSDLEHMAIEILKDDEIAAEYRERYLTIIVDEYQDSNRVQETILNRIARPGTLFFVGDVKQSIYRFRKAEPALFLEKCRDFHGERGTRVDLGDNYRSGQAVVDTVNAVFSTVMKEPVAGIEYDGRAMLKKGNPTVPDGKTELHLFAKDNDPDDAEALEDAEAEARFAANMIRARMERPIVENGKERPCRHDDFAVLLRSRKNARVWVQTLAEAGIPAYAEAAGGYFEAIEVKLLMCFLKVLDNRRQDIPLLAVMRSPMFGFTDGELSAIRAGARKCDLLDCLLKAKETDPKVAAFFDTIERYAALSRRIPLSDLIERVLDETHYREMVGVLPGGDQRVNNLDALVRMAGECDAAGISGVYGFLRFMESIRQAKDLGESKAVTANVVRIMTVHGAKGLEFPIVFYAGLGTQYNRKDEQKQLIPETELGVGLKYADAVGVVHETLTYQNTKGAVADASWAEEMRVLYVGMTRAKQELYLLGSLKNPEDAIRKIGAPTLLNIRSANSALKLLILSLNGRIPLSVHQKSELASGSTHRAFDGIPMPTAQERQDLEARFSWIYPHPTFAALPDKISVTGLNRDEAPEFSEPAFETGYDVLSEGSAVHRALERIPLADEQKRAAFLTTIPGVTDFHADAIRALAASPLFLRMAKAARVEREWSFLCPMPARMLLPETDSDEPILLQGVIDACFVEDGAWVLLDYKTDRVTGDPQEYARKHTRQVALYAEALRRLSGMPVKERYIVLLGANTEVAV